MITTLHLLLLGPSKVCFCEVGCFALRSYCKEDIYLPESPEKIQTKFSLYTSSSKENSREITNHMEEAEFAESGFDSSRATKVVIHGFMSSANHAGIIDIRDEFLAQVWMTCEFMLVQIA